MHTVPLTITVTTTLDVLASDYGLPDSATPQEVSAAAAREFRRNGREEFAFMLSKTNIDLTVIPTPTASLASST